MGPEVILEFDQFCYSLSALLCFKLDPQTYFNQAEIIINICYKIYL